jgi:hypothetical protein
VPLWIDLFPCGAGTLSSDRYGCLIWFTLNSIPVRVVVGAMQVGGQDARYT